MVELMHVAPQDIEKRSMEMISEILGDRTFPEGTESIVKRVIHTTADFEYADLLNFYHEPVTAATEALRRGANIVTDTRMAASGVSRKTLEKLGGRVLCYMDDPETARIASGRGSTRATVCMERAAEEAGEAVYVIGNAPTALIRLYEMVLEGKVRPAAVVAVPVGFVNVVEAKNLFRTCGVPCIVVEGRKGGSNVAAAICNALLYMVDGSRGA